MELGNRISIVHSSFGSNFERGKKISHLPFFFGKWLVLAERTGFEPVESCDTFTDLANRRIRPLCHLSRVFIFNCLQSLKQKIVFKHDSVVNGSRQDSWFWKTRSFCCVILNGNRIILSLIREEALSYSIRKMLRSQSRIRIP